MGAFKKSKNTILRQGSVIFVVTGTQAPFDRLLSILDKWGGAQEAHSIVAQTSSSKMIFKNMTCFDYLEPDVFNEYFNNSDLIIGHAGMGTIIKALENEKRLVVFPRLMKYNEHRNDHQYHTANSFDLLGLINVAYNEDELLAYLDNQKSILIKDRIDTHAERKLIDTLSRFINK